MALKWTMRLTKARMLLGGVYIAVVFIDPARGAVDANERVKEVVAAVAASNRLRWRMLSSAALSVLPS
ncbi:hypothetical protein ABCW43_17745 [Neorhizobium sp. IRAMC:178]|uniref:hypothetical protein n=1 Tax=Neorhizobium tunisiense TaxID=3144793 RepID=UPI0031F6A0C0